MSKEFPKWWLVTPRPNPKQERHIVFAYNDEESLELMDNHLDTYDVTLLTRRRLCELLSCDIPQGVDIDQEAIGPIVFYHEGTRVILHG